MTLHFTTRLQEWSKYIPSLQDGQPIQGGRHEHRQFVQENSKTIPRLMTTVSGVSAPFNVALILHLPDIPDYPPPSFQEAISTPAFPSEMPTSPSTAAPTCSPIQSAESDSNSDSDSDGSMELLYLDSVRQEFASQSHLNLQDESRGRSPIRELDREEESIPSSPQKKRNMSLSPLRTLFPPKHLNLRERTMSAHPSSPYSRSTSFFRSTTSLKSLSGSSMLPSTPTSISGKESLLSFFSSKGKERDERESMDSWVVLETGPEEPQSLMEILESASRHPVPRSWPSSPNDRVSFPPENPRPSPGPSRLQPQGDQHIPPMTPVPILRQPARRYPASSPIQRSMLHIPTELDLDTRTTPVSPSTLPLQPQAVETQSPYTPVELLPVSHSAPGTLVQVSAHRPLLQPLQPVSMTASSRNPMSPSLRSSQSTPTDSTTPTQIVPSGQHYLGRPLPRPPPNSSSTPRTSVDRTKRREVVDSVYASSSETSSVSAPSCPETPLIDFGDSDSITDSDSDSSTPVNTFQAQRSSSASPSSPAAISQRPQASQAATNFSQFTDLDLLVSRLDEAAGQRGLNYDVSGGNRLSVRIANPIRTSS